MLTSTSTLQLLTLLTVAKYSRICCFANIILNATAAFLAANDTTAVSAKAKTANTFNTPVLPLTLASTNCTATEESSHGCWYS